MKNFIIKLKHKFNLFLSHYFNIVRLQTGYRINNIPFLLFILMISILCIFVNSDLLIKLNTYPFLLNSILFCGIVNITFLQFNLANRLTITLLKGLPYFYQEIRYTNKPYTVLYLIAFLIYNTFLITLTFLVLLRLYTVLNDYSPMLYHLTMLYTVTTSYILFRVYIEFNFNKYTYEVDPQKFYSLKLIQKILLLTFPLLLFLNAYSMINKIINLSNNFIEYNTVHCDPIDNTVNTNTQINDNTQESLIRGKQSNNQGNKNIQVSGSKSNINTQTNSNQQVKFPIIDYSVFNTEKFRLHEEIIDNYLFYPFWDNIILLENIRERNIFSHEFINDRIATLVSTATEKSKLNLLFYNNPTNKILAQIIYPDKIYGRFNLYPVYFNNTYEIYDINHTRGKAVFNKIYSERNKSFNLLELYKNIESATINKQLKSFILRNIGIMIEDSSRGLINRNNISDNSIYEIHNNFTKALNRGRIILSSEGVYVFDLFGYKLICVNHTTGMKGSILLDSIDQLRYLVVNEFSNLESIWKDFINKDVLVDIIKRCPELMIEYYTTGTIELSYRNIDYLIEYNYRDNIFFGYYLEIYCNPEIRELVNNELINIKQKYYVLSQIKNFFR
jgi:hypothetical protein